jgi:hypothetical protein
VRAYWLNHPVFIRNYPIDLIVKLALDDQLVDGGSPRGASAREQRLAAPVTL